MFNLRPPTEPAKPKLLNEAELADIAQNYIETAWSYRGAGERQVDVSITELLADNNMLKAESTLTEGFSCHVFWELVGKQLPPGFKIVGVGNRDGGMTAILRYEG